MNNRYICKAKRKDNGEWVEGFYVCLNEDCHLIYAGYAEIDCGYYYPECYEVIPETVCRCTELKDKNGKLIFEGDIIRTQPFSDKPYSSKAKYKQHIGVVEYRVSHFKNSLYEQDYKAEWIVNINDYGKFTCYDWSKFFKCEVIGNIHDNDLLEVER